MSTKSSTCYNNKTTGCTNLVTERGNILCTECTEARKAVIKNRKDVEYDELKSKITHLSRELSIAQEKLVSFDKLVEENNTLRQTVKDKNILYDKLSQKLDATELELSHAKIDCQTLAIENERLSSKLEQESRQESRPESRQEPKPDTTPPSFNRKPSLLKKQRGGKA